MLAITLTACAANVTLTWDFNDPEEGVTAYRIYEVTTAGNVLVATVPGTTNVVTLSDVSPGRRSYVATAVNYWGESDLSNEAKTPPPGQAPKNVKTAP
jgi:hypothetical protein